MSTEPIDVLSGSSLNTFLRCGRQWEYAYVYRIRRPPRLRMIVGTAGHEAIDVDLSQKIESRQEMPLDDVLDAFSTAYDREAQDAEEEPAKGHTRPVMKDRGIRSVTLWHKEVAPEIDPLLVEAPISFDINGIPWTGTLDIVDTSLRLRDWKFTTKTPSSAEAYILNMVGYAIGFRVATGLVEKQIILDHMVGLKKESKYVPIKSEGPVPDSSIEAFTTIVVDAQRSIQAGIFPATGIKSGACSWCGYRDICPAYKDSPLARKGDTE